MRLAFLGLGAMGVRMAARLVNAGHQVTVYNRTPGRDAALIAAGAKAAPTPRAAVEGAEAVIAIVRDDVASRDLWTDPQTGVLAALKPGVLAIEASTVTPGWAGELSALVKATGAAFLDAPVVGSRPQAEAGQLFLLVGGEAADFERAQPIFSVVGAAAHHMGPIGSGATMKLAVNALLGAQIAVVAEMFGMLERSGIELGKAATVLGALPGTSPAAKGAAGLMVARNDAPLFPIELVEKDFGYALAVAAERGLELPVTTAVRNLFATAMAKGLGGANSSAVRRLFTDA